MEHLLVHNQLFNGIVQQMIHGQFRSLIFSIILFDNTGIKTTRIAEPLWYPKSSSAGPAESHEAEPSAF